MIVRVNGQYLMTTGEDRPNQVEEEMIVIGRGFNTKLKKIAIAFWTLSASFMAKSKVLAAAPSTGSGQLWEEMKPLLYFFQDLAMFAGTLAIIAGIILLVVKRRWGITTLKTSAFAVLGIFLVPSAVLLLAILGMFLDDSLTAVLNNIREARGTLPVDGGDNMIKVLAGTGVGFILGLTYGLWQYATPDGKLIKVIGYIKGLIEAVI